MLKITSALSIVLMLSVSGSNGATLTAKSKVSHSMQPSKAVSIYCPSISDGDKVKYTCSFGSFIFSHDNSGVNDANMDGVKAQFVVDKSDSPNVETIVQGSASGIDWELTVVGFELAYKDAAGIIRVMNPERIVPNPSVFACRVAGKALSGSGRVKRDFLEDAIRRGETMTLTAYVSLRSGIPGAGC